jgi:hypothetical protein
MAFFLGNWCRLLVTIKVLMSIGILGWYTKPSDIWDLEWLVSLLARGLIVLAARAHDHLVVHLTALAVWTFRFTVLHSLSSGLAIEGAVSTSHQLWNELLADLRCRLVRQNRVGSLRLTPHMRKVTVFHILVQFEVLHSILKQLVVVLQFHFIVHEQLVVFEAVVHFFIERWQLWKAIYV